jgi:hypothetical protein
MIPKSGHRFSEKIMLKQKGINQDSDSKNSYPGLGGLQSDRPVLSVMYVTPRRGGMW